MVTFFQILFCLILLTYFDMMCFIKMETTHLGNWQKCKHINSITEKDLSYVYNCWLLFQHNRVERFGVFIFIHIELDLNWKEVFPHKEIKKISFTFEQKCYKTKQKGNNLPILKSQGVLRSSWSSSNKYYFLSVYPSTKSSFITQSSMLHSANSTSSSNTSSSKTSSQNNGYERQWYWQVQ